jgi:hypothetical protein
MSKFRKYDDNWMIAVDERSVEFVGMGTVLHQHLEDGINMCYSLNQEGECRRCGTTVPAGIKVSAMLERL